jgi:hypothetical protein
VPGRISPISTIFFNVPTFYAKFVKIGKLWTKFKKRTKMQNKKKPHGQFKIEAKSFFFTLILFLFLSYNPCIFIISILIQKIISFAFQSKARESHLKKMRKEKVIGLITFQ